MIRLTCLALLAVSAFAAESNEAAGCFPLTQDHILGRDVAAVLPELAALTVLAPEAQLGLAPAAGMMRVFQAAQLQQWAEKYGVHASIKSAACFTWPLHPLTQPLLMEAMRKSLAGQQVELEITDQSHFPVPDGELTFPLQGFSGESDKPALWNGFVTYGNGRRFTTWVRVRITVHEKHMLATRALLSGEVVDAGAIKTVDYQGPLRRSAVSFQDESEVIGKSVRWSVAEGSPLTKNMLAAPFDVEKAQLVTVHIDNGAAHIETQGIADCAGYKGTVIRVRNPKTGRVFRARIDDRGLVTVVPGGAIGLVVEEKKS